MDKKDKILAAQSRLDWYEDAIDYATSPAEKTAEDRAQTSGGYAGRLRNLLDVRGIGRRYAAHEGGSDRRQDRADLILGHTGLLSELTDVGRLLGAEDMADDGGSVLSVCVGDLIGYRRGVGVLRQRAEKRGSSLLGLGVAGELLEQKRYRDGDETADGDLRYAGLFGGGVYGVVI